MKGYVIVMIVENQANVAASNQTPLPRKKNETNNANVTLAYLCTPVRPEQQQAMNFSLTSISYS